MEHGSFELFPARSKDSAYCRVPGVTAFDETVSHVDPSHDRRPDSGRHYSHSSVNRKGFEESTEILLDRSPTTTDTLPWLPGVLKHVPWLGLCALVVSISCMAVSIAVLVMSNGRLVTSWWIQPTVFLAAASATANIALQFALAEGVTVSWWYRALRGGTLGDLHRSWSFGTYDQRVLYSVPLANPRFFAGKSVWAVLTAGRYFNKVALASIVVSVAVVDGPLLQRASTIVSKDITSSITVHASIAPQLPVGYTSTMLGRVEYPKILNRPFADVLQDYSRRTPISAGFEGCEGKCETVVQGAGFSVDCQPPTRTPIDYNPPKPLKNGSLPATAFNNQPIFSVALSWLHGQRATDKNHGTSINSSMPEQLVLSIGYTDTKKCAGSFVTKDCTLTEAVVDYQILLDNKTVSLNNPTVNPPVVSMGNSTPDVSPGYLPGKQITLGGFALAGTDLFASNTSVRFVGAAGMYEVAMFNTFASQYILTPNYIMNCQFDWRDPTNDILIALHEIMFRTALKAANAADSVSVQNAHGNRTFDTKQSVHATQTGVQNVFVSHYGYLFGALAVMTFGVLSVIPTFYGWWRLGRPMTLSPIETAKAFNAPLLNQSKSRSNADVDRLIRDIGDRPVRYGEVAVVVPTYSGGPYGTETTSIGGNTVGERRLEMAHPDIVLRPRKGARFDT